MSVYLACSFLPFNPGFTRAKLSREVCRMFQWLKPDGKLKDMSCRVAMLRMEKDGLIRLPAPTYVKKSVKKIKFTTATDPQRMIVCTVNHLPKLHLQLVTKATSAIWNEYIERYHYLGYTPLPGAQLRYFIGRITRWYKNRLIVAERVSETRSYMTLFRVFYLCGKEAVY